MYLKFTFQGKYVFSKQTFMTLNGSFILLHDCGHAALIENLYRSDNIHIDILIAHCNISCLTAYFA